jgi:ABC-type transporter Mla MlaB component
MQTILIDRHEWDRLKSTLADIQTKVNQLLNQENKIMASLDALQAEVARNTTVESSALALIQGLAAQITAAGTDPVKLKAITDQLTNNDDALASAVAQNTPAA